MKFVKTVKGKVTVSIMAVLLISSAGVVFASTDVGQNLQNWYEKVFIETTDDAMNESKAYGEGAVSDFKADYAERKDQKSAQIDRKRAWETNDKKDNIHAAKEEHIDDLEGSKEAILSGMEHQFYNVYTDAWMEIQARANEAEKLLHKDMGQFAVTKGDAAVAQLNSDLDQAKIDAVSELEDAIDNAKAEISAELGDQGDNLVYNLNGQIDHEIASLTKTVGDALYDLTKKQETLISEAADTKETKAKEALEAVVENVNN